MIRERTFTAEMRGTRTGCEQIAALSARAGSAIRGNDLETVSRGGTFWWLLEGTAG